MADRAFLLDLGRCIGCEACVVACKVGNELEPGERYIELRMHTRGTYPDVSGGFQNHRCYHCADAACVAVCPTGALYREHGLTRLDQSACSGCGYCVEACPYQVPVMVAGRATKCDGCAQTVASGREPWCVQTCPSRALQYGERSAILAEAHLRVAAMRAHDPTAAIYGETQTGGLGMLVVTPCTEQTPAPASQVRRTRARCPDNPQAIGLPSDPRIPGVVGTWQNVVQPAVLGISAMTAVAAGVGAVIARRNHMRELEELEAAPVAAGNEEGRDE